MIELPGTQDGSLLMREKVRKTEEAQCEDCVPLPETITIGEQHCVPQYPRTRTPRTPEPIMTTPSKPHTHNQTHSNARTRDRKTRNAIAAV